MGKIKTYPPVKYFAAITFRSKETIFEVENKLEKVFSPIDARSDDYYFSQFTNYYQDEMGSDLRKRIIAFFDLKPASLLPDSKLATNKLEEEFSDSGNRTVNIDPGYVNAAKMVLATTKDYDHRLYLERGIFGDLHMRFRQGNYHPSDWAYPDYRQSAVIAFFRNIREIYLTQLKDWPAEDSDTLQVITS